MFLRSNSPALPFPGVGQPRAYQIPGRFRAAANSGLRRPIHGKQRTGFGRPARVAIGSLPCR